MSTASAEARRRVILKLLREGRIGPGAADPAVRRPGAPRPSVVGPPRPGDGSPAASA